MVAKGRRRTLVGERVRAALVEAPGAPVSIELIDLDDLEPDEVLVRIGACGICHTDLVWIGGGTYDQFPVVVGHEAAGTVEAVGPRVTRVAPGDRVVLSLAHHCGHCFYCESGSPMLCDGRVNFRPRLSRDGRRVFQGFGTGGFAEKTVVGERSVVKIPDAVPIEVAALTGCAVATGVGAAVNIAKVQPGSSVAVLGVGGIGASITMGARVAGAATIVAADPDPKRRELALRIGATDAVVPEALERETFDYAFEATGLVEVMEQATRLVRRGGTIVVLGVPKADATFRVLALDFIANQRTLLGAITGDLRPNVDFARYFALYERGLLPLDELITGSVPLDDIATGFERAAKGDGIRTLVIP
jgi:2-desacetyl-2-hydroxyethyl bacteriochlorophyllide A dehydrogenase